MAKQVVEMVGLCTFCQTEKTVLSYRNIWLCSKCISVYFDLDEEIEYLENLKQRVKKDNERFSRILSGKYRGSQKDLSG
jgi:ribosomal protein L37AE/L43A